MKTVPDLCRRRAELSPDAVAFETVASGETLTFAATDEAVGRAVGALADLGLVAGDRLAVLCHNDPAFFVLLFAAARARLVLVPLNWRLTPAELVPILDDCSPKLLICDAAHADLAESLSAGWRC